MLDFARQRLGEMPSHSLAKIFIGIALVILCSILYSWDFLMKESVVLVSVSEGPNEVNVDVSDNYKKRRYSRKERIKFHCPYVPPDSEDIKNIFSNKTMEDLQKQVSRFNKSRPVVLIVANQPALYLVANWICIARLSLSYPPTENLLVMVTGPLAGHGANHLAKNGISSVLITFNERCLEQSEVIPVLKLHTWYKALTSRILTVMLLTEWGFDVMVHDPDAYIIKDPLQMYSDIIKAKDPHIIAQKGIMPAVVATKWGFTMVMGAILYRSSTELKMFWRKVSEQHFKSQNSIKEQLDDQRVTNTALMSSEIKWSKKPIVYNSTYGITEGGLRVVALDANYSFRGGASLLGDHAIDMDKLMILHPTLGHSLDKKIEKLQDMNLWLLSVSEDAFKNMLKLTHTTEEWLDGVCKRETRLKVTIEGLNSTDLI